MLDVQIVPEERFISGVIDRSETDLTSSKKDFPGLFIAINGTI